MINIFLYTYQEISDSREIHVQQRDSVLLRQFESTFNYDISIMPRLIEFVISVIIS